jgi:hypothetical protein
MTTNEDEVIDFKPFFDLVVGILFILLILVASQLFFSRWKDTPSPQDAAAQAREQRRVATLADIDTFLDGLSNALGKAGFTPALDRVGRRIIIPSSEVLKAQAGASTRLGRTLLAQLHCVDGSSGPARAGCAGKGVARIAAVKARLQLPGQPGAATPAPPARVAGLTLSASLFSATPDLLAVTSPGGGPAVSPEITVTALPATTQPAPEGDFTLQFTFADTDTN